MITAGKINAEKCEQIVTHHAIPLGKWLKRPFHKKTTIKKPPNPLKT